MFLGQLPQSKNCPPIHPWGTIFLGGNCLVAPNPKTNSNIVPNPNPNHGGRGGGNIPDTSLNKMNVFCLLIADYDNKKPEN